MTYLDTLEIQTGVLEDPTVADLSPSAHVFGAIPGLCARDPKPCGKATLEACEPEDGYPELPTGLVERHAAAHGVTVESVVTYVPAVRRAYQVPPSAIARIECYRDLRERNWRWKQIGHRFGRSGENARDEFERAERRANGSVRKR